MKRHSFNLLCLLMILAMLMSCSRRHYRPSLKDVLKHNPALEQVLERYEGNSLKTEAAEFLLMNLPYYYSYSEKDMEAYLKVHEYYGVGKWYSVQQAQDSAMRQYGTYNAITTNKISDLTISPEFLIENIDWAFKVREEQPWSKNVSWEDFCEYILPYRIKDECLKPWREKLYNKYNPMLDDIRDLPEAEDPLFVSRVLIDSISREESRFSSLLGYGPHIGPDVVDWVSGNCRELTDRLIYIFRALGLPCGCDYMPLRGDGNVAHYWIFVLDKEGTTYCMYEKQAIKTMEDFFDCRAKIYRQTFSMNEEEQDRIRCDLRKVYPNFRYPMYKDITRMYSDVFARTLTVPREELISDIKMNEIVYLCSSSHMKWLPVAWTYPDRDSITFNDVQGRVILCLAVYRDGELIPVSEPFELNKETGNVHYYHAADTLEDVKLLNKYHQFYESFPQRMVGGTFEGSDYADFRVKDTLHIITEPPLRLHNVVKLPDAKKYRYVRYHGPAEAYCNVAEVSFYSDIDGNEYLTGDIIGTPNGEGGDKEHDYKNVYDGNPSTSFNYDLSYGGWSGLDLKTEQPISRIVYTARNRENYINAGDTYELFYSSAGQWHSVGIQIPTGDSLVYSVPKGALLYLKNHAGGVEERIFDYHEGLQRYW